MDDDRIDRWFVASGYLAIGLGIAGATFERGSPAANATIEQTLEFWSGNRRELLNQSMMFSLGAIANLAFFGALRAKLSRAEGYPAALSTIAFGAGIVSVTLQLVLQMMQVAIVTAPALDAGVASFLSRAMWALSIIAYVPMAAMLAAVAAVVLRCAELPRWLGVLSAVVALIHVVMWLGLVAERGPLVAGGVLTYALYLGLLGWLIATTIALGRWSDARL